MVHCCNMDYQPGTRSSLCRQAYSDVLVVAHRRRSPIVGSPLKVKTVCSLNRGRTPSSSKTCIGGILYNVACMRIAARCASLVEGRVDFVDVALDLCI